MTLSAVLFAAGMSARMGCDKLLMQYKGRTLLSRAVELLTAIEADERIIVITRDRLSKCAVPSGIKVCVNPNPQKGKSGSVRIGAAAAGGTHYFFLNADQPDLEAGDIMPMIELAKQNTDKIIYPVIDGSPCSPAIFPAAFRESLLTLTGDVGGSVVRNGHPQLCIPYRPERPEKFKDIDTKEAAL